MTELFTTGLADPTPAIHLPDVGVFARRETAAEVAALREQLLDLGVLVPCISEACVGDGEHYCGGAQVVAFAAEVLEETLSSDPESIDPALAAEFGLLALTAGTAEMMVAQIAFGESAGRLEALHIARLAAQAQQRGMSIDEYVAERARRGDIVLAPVARSLRGDTRRPPDGDRVGRGIAVLRRLAALLPATMASTCLAMIGWLHWSRGKRALALAYLRAAQILGPSGLTVHGFTWIVATRTPKWLR